jgi:putative tryptophan/tyrosine transport system substrate-binding protein
MTRLTRRAFVAVTAGSAAATGLLLTIANSSSARGLRDVPRIGYLAAGDRQSSEGWAAALVTGLREYGYIEGGNLDNEWRFADNVAERLPGLAADLVAKDARVIVTSSTPAAEAASRTTSSVPIVATGPGTLRGLLSRELVENVARPGGNVTGNCCTAPLLNKRAELLKDAVPGLTSVAHLKNPNGRGTRENWIEFEAAAVRLEFEPVHLEARIPAELHAALDGAVVIGADGLQVNGETLFSTTTDVRVVHRALERRLLFVHAQRRPVLPRGRAHVICLRHRGHASACRCLRGQDSERHQPSPAAIRPCRPIRSGC